MLHWNRPTILRRDKCQKYLEKNLNAIFLLSIKTNMIPRKRTLELEMPMSNMSILKLSLLVCFADSQIIQFLSIFALFYIFTDFLYEFFFQCTDFSIDIFPCVFLLQRSWSPYYYLIEYIIKKPKLIWFVCMKRMGEHFLW